MSNISDDMKARMTKDFLASPFWLEVLKPAIDEQAENMHYRAMNADTLEKNFALSKVEQGLRMIEATILPYLERLDLPNKGFPSYGTA